ncbi:HIT family protein [Azospira restricta]|uniref:HIT family protein n=1 Tax=Azospira restricta TaxID=404405 RepID=A0A974SSB4_9RHOO|nr:HIT family protein [Azospira restricta]
MSGHLARAADECELCHAPGGELLWEDALCRVIAVADDDYPGFCRVILNRHAAEMSDLDAGEQQALMRVVLAVEGALRQLYRPDKINLASFGNVVPHLHWHVIPRWKDDRHFPQPIWGTPQRTGGGVRPAVSRRQLAGELAQRLGAPQRRGTAG